MQHIYYPIVQRLYIKILSHSRAILFAQEIAREINQRDSKTPSKERDVLLLETEDMKQPLRIQITKLKTKQLYCYTVFLWPCH